MQKSGLLPVLWRDKRYFKLLILGFVKKVGALKIVHEKYRAKKTAAEQATFHQSFDTASQLIPELRSHINKAQDDLNPIKVYEMFQKISSEVLILILIARIVKFWAWILKMAVLSSICGRWYLCRQFVFVLR